MIVKTLYRFIRPNGGVTVSLNKPGVEYTTLVRLIADVGKVLVKDGVEYHCIDTDSSEGWVEYSHKADHESVAWTEETLLSMPNAELEQILATFGITASMTKVTMVKVILLAQGGGAA